MLAERAAALLPSLKADAACTRLQLSYPVINHGFTPTRKAFEKATHALSLAALQAKKQAKKPHATAVFGVSSGIAAKKKKPHAAAVAAAKKKPPHATAAKKKKAAKAPRISCIVSNPNARGSSKTKA